MLHKPRELPHVERITEAFDREALRRICQMDEADFIEAFDLERWQVTRQRFKSITPTEDEDDFFGFRDNGSQVLAVAHLDTVVRNSQRSCSFVDTAAGEVVHSGALDDRLGAYVILDLLPKLGINVDLLLTTGEESARSTAEFFQPTKNYNWIIEFDRGGTDVVMYQFDDEETRDLVEMTGARVGEGIFSDICYLEHLGVKAFNWGVGYQDYHSTRSHAYLEDLFEMVNYFVEFHELVGDEELPHQKDAEWLRYGNLSTWWDEQDERDRRLMEGEVVDDEIEDDAALGRTGAPLGLLWDADEPPDRGIDDMVRIEDLEDLEDIIDVRVSSDGAKESA